MNKNAKKCLACDNETYQEDGMCILCKTGLTRIDDELIDALKKDNRWNLQGQKAAALK